MRESYNKFATGGLFETYPTHYNKYSIFLYIYPIITLVGSSEILTSICWCIKPWPIHFKIVIKLLFYEKKVMLRKTKSEVIN